MSVEIIRQHTRISGQSDGWITRSAMPCMSDPDLDRELEKEIERHNTVLEDLFSREHARQKASDEASV